MRTSWFKVIDRHFANHEWMPLPLFSRMSHFWYHADRRAQRERVAWPVVLVEAFGRALAAKMCADQSRAFKKASNRQALTEKYIYIYVNILSSGGWVKINLELPHFHVSNTCRASIQPKLPLQQQLYIYYVHIFAICSCARACVHDSKACLPKRFFAQIFEDLTA